MSSLEEGIRWQVDSLRRLLSAGFQVGIRLMYEPTASENDTPERLQRILSELPDLLCHLDVGHCNLHGKDPAAMIRHFGHRLHHLHLHDNDGRSDLHLPPGVGTIDWASVIRALKEVGYDGTITLEIGSPDRDYVLLAMKKIQALWARSGGRRP